jgi:CheY-like chemotaxis protein
MARILLVDDDAMLRDTVAQMLELDRHTVIQASDGQDGLKRFREGHFDLVMTDILMPRMDGAEFIAALRQADSQVPVIAISGGRRVLSPRFNLETAALAGANAQLAKPFGRQQLQSTLQAVLKR